MEQVVQFTAPGQVELVECEQPPLPPGHARIATLYSGISAGTELTAYRGTNPYLTKRWESTSRLFVKGEASFGYPILGWGYEQVGRVTEIATGSQADTALRVGDVVWGIWGHRSTGVVELAALAGHRMPPGLDPLAGVFVRPGAIALNAVLDAALHLTEYVVIFGQGVLGLLATRLAVLAGARVIAVDPIANRRELALRFGARHTVDPGAEQVADRVREITGHGADVAIEFSGSYAALHQATRAVAPGGRVAAAGFYQGEGQGLWLGEEFHHNRVELVASQISTVAARLAPRWDRERLHLAFAELLADGTVDPLPLVTHRLPAAEVAAAFGVLDQRPAEALQTVLVFGGEEDP